MINDFQSETGFENLHCDICIVGSGALGISLAREFIDTPHRVVLLEAGGPSLESETQELYQTLNKGLQHNNYTGRIRIFGGTTTRWAGQASPFDDIDFEKREWVPHSGWPIGRETLEPYFSRVEKLMGVEHRSYDSEDWPRESSSLPPMDKEQFRLVYSQFSPHANFAEAYGHELKEAKNIQVLFHANATHLQLDSNATSLNHIDYKALSGKLGRVSARYFILCCGGIETARLLLSSKDVVAEGVGNSRDMVGRFFHDHIHMHVAQIKARDFKKLKTMQTFYQKSIRYCPKVAISSDLQREEKILNIAGDIYYKNDPQSALQTLKELVKFRKRGKLSSFPGGLWSALARIGLGSPKILKALYKYAIRGEVMVDDSGPLYLGIQCEQAPNPESRIYLSEERDALGVPKAVVQWKLTDLDAKTIEVFIEKVNEEFQKIGLAELRLETLAQSDDSSFPFEVFDSNHHMGTTRMAAHPDEGVVDENCCVHGLENLYIAGTSTLPTGGFSNPTFNAMALGLRLSDRLKDFLSQQQLGDLAQ